MSWRGRGRGGRSNNSNHHSNRGAFQQFGESRSVGGNSSVFSRLGPINSIDGGDGMPTRDSFSENFRSGSQRNNGRPFESDRQYNDSFNQPRGGGSGSSGGGGRGGGGGGSGGGNFNQRFQQRDSNRGGRRRYTHKLVDEDIEMGQSEGVPADAIVVTVTGHPERSEGKLIEFLKRKSKAFWEPIDVRTSFGTTYIYVGDDSTANAICRCNNYTFLSAILSISKGGAPSTEMGGFVNNNNNSGQRPNQGRRPNMLQEFLNERWDPQNGFLSLDELPPTSHSITTVITRLLHAARDLYGNNVITISFAKNNLWSLQPLKNLPEIFPGLQNLSVQDNEIADFRSLDAFAKLNIPNLTELVLAGNPIQTNNDWDYYSSEIIKRFPTLRILDRLPLNGPSSMPSQPPVMGSNMPSPGFPLVSTSQPAINVPRIQGSFYDNDNSRQATTDFLSKLVLNAKEYVKDEGS
ncbi:hypothetical protein BX666DRAFT_1915903 [Dichotomocladium elegans]|nr:hypothetical protein BX666DRAFT_1915903 [Dichotomocladium elegans]